MARETTACACMRRYHELVKHAHNSFLLLIIGRKLLVDRESFDHITTYNCVTQHFLW